MDRILSLHEALTKEFERTPALQNIHPAYESVLVDFDPSFASAEEVVALIESCLRAPSSREDRARIVDIPVYYGDVFGPDLAQVAELTKVSEDEVIHLHSAVKYRVAFLGFSPGFPYLEGLDPRLACPRLATPRVRVPAGSVAIGGTQTGIYPSESPGGWLIIGRTFEPLFDVRADRPVLLGPGDWIQFHPVRGEKP